MERARTVQSTGPIFDLHQVLLETLLHSLLCGSADEYADRIGLRIEGRKIDIAIDHPEVHAGHLACFGGLA